MNKFKIRKRGNKGRTTLDALLTVSCCMDPRQYLFQDYNKTLFMVMNSLLQFNQEKDSHLYDIQLKDAIDYYPTAIRCTNPKYPPLEVTYNTLLEKCNILVFPTKHDYALDFNIIKASTGLEMLDLTSMDFIFTAPRLTGGHLCNRVVLKGSPAEKNLLKKANLVPTSIIDKNTKKPLVDMFCTPQPKYIVYPPNTDKNITVSMIKSYFGKNCILGDRTVSPKKFIDTSNILFNETHSTVWEGILYYYNTCLKLFKEDNNIDKVNMCDYYLELLELVKNKTL